ncbi:serine protease grass-like [Lucilia cuprina]|uniref:serine protease grass-like n=1 Tax=Lucilia cuprina TaxID=7375 RepID=UPI001F0603AD|nr:serine protease grass-like [Lucilia cuprina]
MIFEKFAKILILKFVIIIALVEGGYHHGLSTHTDCLTPEHVRGSCVPSAKCRRIEWMLDNWSAPYPEHVVRYIRQSHCGTQGDIHFNCCAFYDIKGHIHPPTQNAYTPTTPTPPVHNLHHAFHSGQSQHLYSNNLPFQHRPTANYIRQPLGERILRSMACGSINGDRISNGELVRLSEFPWMVLLETRDVRSRERFRCSGTLITNQYVLTAGHCADAKNDIISVRLGEHDLKSEHDCEHYKKPHVVSYCAPPYEDVDIETIILHPEYNANTLENDIALIRLVRSVEFQSHIKPVCLPIDAGTTNEIPTDQIVAGWGVTEKGYASEILLKASIPVQPLAVCQNIYQPNPPLSEAKLCAGGVDKRSTCRADSGGPLFTAIPYEHYQRRYVQFGITSAGSKACGGRHNLPGIYTNVRTFIPWIISNIY